MQDDRRTYDPYQPPAAPAKREEPIDDSEDDGSRSVPLVIVYCVFSLGLYAIYWLWERRNFLVQRGIRAPFGPALIIALVVLDAVSLSARFLPGAQSWVTIVALAAGIVRLVALFAMRDAINAWAGSLGVRGGPRSSAGTFFFGVLYLQHAMNTVVANAREADALEAS